jgi:hypothetical protein
VVEEGCGGGGPEDPPEPPHRETTRGSAYQKKPSRFPFVRAFACREQDGYEVLRNVVANEKYSEVFEGFRAGSQERCAIKILKPVRKV